jgi:hypothetical protein
MQVFRGHEKYVNMKGSQPQSKFCLKNKGLALRQTGMAYTATHQTGDK